MLADSMLGGDKRISSDDGQRRKALWAISKFLLAFSLSFGLAPVAFPGETAVPGGSARQGWPERLSG